MSLEEVKRIKDIFISHNMHPTYVEHAPVITSEDAAKTRGFELKQGIKAIVLTNGEEYVVVDVPAHRKVDVKKAAGVLGWSKGKTRMATAQEVLDKTGCELGAVPPFGHKLRIFVDNGIYDNRMNAFNIGLRTHSVKIQTKEMKQLFGELGAVEGEFAQ